MTYNLCRQRLVQITLHHFNWNILALVDYAIHWEKWTFFLKDHKYGIVQQFLCHSYDLELRFLKFILRAALRTIVFSLSYHDSQCHLLVLNGWKALWPTPLRNPVNIAQFVAILILLKSFAAHWTLTSRRSIGAKPIFFVAFLAFSLLFLFGWEIKRFMWAAAHNFVIYWVGSVFINIALLTKHIFFTISWIILIYEHLMFHIGRFIDKSHTFNAITYLHFAFLLGKEFVTLCSISLRFEVWVFSCDRFVVLTLDTGLFIRIFIFFITTRFVIALR